LRANRTLDHPYKIQAGFYPRIVPRMYSNFRMGGIATSSLEHLIRSLLARRIRVVLVEMPITADVYPVHPNGLDDYRRFERSLTAIASLSGARLVNMIPSFPSTEQFADPLHLNFDGRDRFTRILGDLLKTSPA